MKFALKSAETSSQRIYPNPAEGRFQTLVTLSERLEKKVIGELKRDGN